MPGWIGCGILLMLCAAHHADACSCGRPQSPCQAFGTASAVFLGKAVKSERQVIGTRESAYFQMNFTFEVLESFRGIATHRVRVHTGMGGGDCGIPFKIGGTYLIYADSAGASPQSFETGICSGTRPVEEASAALLYLRSLAGEGPNGKISGYVSTEPPNRWEEYAGKGGLAGVAVRIESDHIQREAQTNETGAFEFADVPPGEYRISAAMPRKLSGGAPRNVSLSPKACLVEPFIAKEPGAN